MEKLLNTILTELEDKVVGYDTFENKVVKQCTFEIKSHDLLEVCKFLKNDSRLSFDMLVDLTAVDYSKFPKKTPERFAVIYYFYSYRHNLNIRMKVWVSETNPELDSVISIWRTSDFQEREVYDLFGIKFKNHPNLKRLLLPDTFTEHPLRKDYPLKGKGERTMFPVYRR